MLFYLLEHPDSTRKDLVRGTGRNLDAVARAVADLVTLGYVNISPRPPLVGVPDRFTANRSEFVSDLTALRDRFTAGLDPRTGVPRRS
ncbi:hypothetical protein ACR5MH_0200 (plasmid) [Streptomyces sp. L7]